MILFNRVSRGALRCNRGDGECERVCGGWGVVRWICTVFVLLGVVGCRSVVWHQQYEAVEEACVYEFVDMGLREASEMFGEPIVGVRGVHVRSSVMKKRGARVSLADVVDWGELSETLCRERGSGGGMSVVWSQLGARERGALVRVASGGSELTIGEKIDIVKCVNEVIGSGGFCSGGEVRNRRELEVRANGSVAEYKGKVKVREGFELCECIDEEAGEFVLYVISSLGDEVFYLELGHEVCHLLNARLYDWYVEGLCNVFARRMAMKTGVDWGVWERRFAARSGYDPYAISYHMMSEVCEVVGDDVYGIFDSAVGSNGGNGSGVGGKMHLEIDRWLNGLGVEKRGAVVGIIGRYEVELTGHKGKKNEFVLPRELSGW